MKELPDSSFFSKNPIGWKNLTHAKAVDLLPSYRNGLGKEYSKSTNDSGFKYIDRVRLNKFAYLTTEFSVDVMETGLRDFQFRTQSGGSGCEIEGGYPGNALIPYVPTPSGEVKQLAYMRPRTDTGTSVAPSRIGFKSTQDPNWKQMTPTWVDFKVDNFVRIIYCATWNVLKSKCQPYYTDVYVASVMENVYACADYNSSGKGKKKYGALFGWGWDKKESIYRLYRIKNVYFAGDEIVEVNYNTSGELLPVFCRYYNGTDCTVVNTSLAGSYGQYLLCGQYEVKVVGSGGCGWSYLDVGSYYAMACSGGSGSGIRGKVKLTNGVYGYVVGSGGTTSLYVGMSDVDMSGGRDDVYGTMGHRASSSSSSFGSYFIAAGGNNGNYTGSNAAVPSVQKTNAVISSSVVYGSSPQVTQSNDGIAARTGSSGPFGELPGSSGGAYACVGNGCRSDSGSDGQVEIVYLYPLEEENLVTVRFLDWDGVTLVKSVRVRKGQSVKAPALPSAPNGYTSSYDKTVYTNIVESQDIVASLKIDSSSCSQMTAARPSVTATALCIRLKRTVSSKIARIYWGDGTYSDTSKDSSVQYLSHSYGDTTNHQILIDANVTWFAIGDDASGPISGDSVLYIKAFDRWGAGIVSANSTFKGCTNLVQNTIPVWGPNIADVSHCYEGCTGLGSSMT